jgi:hypothetical protein
MMPLGMGVLNVCLTNLPYLFQQGRIRQQRLPQPLPIRTPTARDHVINRRKSQTVMVQMPVKHRNQDNTPANSVEPFPPFFPSPVMS